MQKVNFQKPKSEVMKSGDSLTTNFCDKLSITRSTRHFPPTHYKLKIESYSLLSEIGLEKYESGVFEAGGHKWRLSLYPKGNKIMNGSGHISLYLAIVGTKNLPLCWEVYVSFKFLMLDQIRDKYLTIQDADDGYIKRFHDLKTEWGFAKFFPLDYFNDVSYGFLVNDCCIFGVEVFVHERSGKRECVSMIKEPFDRTWKIESFSTQDDEFYYSQEFTVGDLQWKLLVYPKGATDEIAKAISVYLSSCDCLKSEKKFFAEYKLRIRNQIKRNHKERTAKHWFSTSENEWGFNRFLLLKDLNDASKGFLVNDTLIIEAEIIVMSNVKELPKVVNST